MRVRFLEPITVAIDGIGFKTERFDAGAILENAPASLAADLIRGGVAEAVDGEEKPKLSAKDAIAEIAAAETLDALEAMIAREDAREGGARKSVKEAADARLAELLAIEEAKKGEQGEGPKE